MHRTPIPITCKVCQVVFKSASSLGHHVRNAHQLNSPTYWDNYEGRTNCEECGKPTSFSGLGLGYARYCGHSCGGTAFRRNMANDNERQQTFIAKVKENQARVWAERSAEEKNAISVKSAKRIFETFSKMSIEERKSKFRNWIKHDPRSPAAIAKRLTWQKENPHLWEEAHKKRKQTFIDSGRWVDIRLELPQYTNTRSSFAELNKLSKQQAKLFDIPIDVTSDVSLWDQVQDVFYQNFCETFGINHG